LHIYQFLSIPGGVALSQGHIGKTCPYCQFPLKADSEVVKCPACKVPHHRECWAENGGCTTFGCRETAYQSAVADRLEISFDEPSGRETVPTRGGGLNKLLVAALVTTLLVLVVLAFAYINLLGDRTAVIDDPSAPISPGSASDPGDAKDEPPQTYDPAVIAADYYIDYENGTIPLGDMPIGARVVDPSWEWEYRLGVDYSDRDWDSYPTPPGEVKPVTWIVVAIDHYEGLEPHVTLLSEDLIGQHTFDNSKGRGHEYDEFGYNHWGDSGTANATFGLRPWLNSTGIHSVEGFYRAFSENFKGAVLTTTVPNKEWQNSSTYNTIDNVFIPSTTELGDIQHRDTYQIGSIYPYYQGADNARRVAIISGETELYWTRSPDTYSGSHVRFVSLDGKFFHYYGAGYSGYAVRPALNLKSEILVSEIRN
jgi:hypothetical protein